MAADYRYGYHELLHTAHIMACMWEEHILNHPVLKNNPELKAEALRIETEILGFYQQVGKTEADWENGKFPKEYVQS